MTNMGYCRFRNTLLDLQDCFDHIWDDLSENEDIARAQLVALCREIADEVRDDKDDNEGDW